MNNETTSVCERLMNIKATLNTVRQQLSTVVTQGHARADIVGEREKRLIRLESDMQEVKNDIGHIKSNIANIQEDIRIILARIDNLTSRIDNLE